MADDKKNWTDIPARRIVRSILDKTLILARMSDKELDDVIGVLAMIDRKMPVPADPHVYGASL